MTDIQFIHSKRWRSVRAAVLRRDSYLDRVALRYGKRITADRVHHIFPRELFPEYTFEPWNLISVANATHNTLHDRSGQRLTAEGMRLLERTARRQGIKITDEIIARLKDDQG